LVSELTSAKFVPYSLRESVNESAKFMKRVIIGTQDSADSMCLQALSYVINRRIFIITG
jgi:hypothetical protein